MLYLYDTIPRRQSQDTAKYQLIATVFQLADSHVIDKIRRHHVAKIAIGCVSGGVIDDLQLRAQLRCRAACVDVSLHFFPKNNP